MKNFFLVVLSMVGELWTGFFYRKPEFYDTHTVTKTKAGYVIFATFATLVTLGIVTWLYKRIN